MKFLISDSSKSLFASHSFITKTYVRLKVFVQVLRAFCDLPASKCHSPHPNPAASLCTGGLQEVFRTCMAPASLDVIPA